MKAMDALQLVSLELIFEMRGEYDTSFLWASYWSGEVR